MKLINLSLETLRTRCNFFEAFLPASTGLSFSFPDIPWHFLLAWYSGFSIPLPKGIARQWLLLSSFSLFYSSWNIFATYLSVWEGDDLLIHTKWWKENWTNEHEKQLIILSPLALPPSTPDDICISKEATVFIQNSVKWNLRQQQGNTLGYQGFVGICFIL